MTELNTDTPATATLTAKQLFNRFVDAPLRKGARSTLIASNVAEFSEWGNYGAWENYVGLAQPVLSEELPDEIREAVCDSDDPASELDMYIMDLEGLASGLILMRNEFKILCDATHVYEPSESAAKGEGDGELRYALTKAPTEGIECLAADLIADNG